MAPVCLITGAGDGTGAACARRFAAGGYRVAMLARTEERMVGARQSVGAGQAWWRPLHMALAGIFVAGLLTHIVVVTFFAGYVAEGRDIYWWHITAW